MVLCTYHPAMNASLAEALAKAVFFFPSSTYGMEELVLCLTVGPRGHRDFD